MEKYRLFKVEKGFYWTFNIFYYAKKEGPLFIQPLWYLFQML